MKPLKILYAFYYYLIFYKKVAYLNCDTVAVTATVTATATATVTVTVTAVRHQILQTADRVIPLTATPELPLKHRLPMISGPVWKKPSQISSEKETERV